MQANGDFLRFATARVLLLASLLLAPQVMADNLTVELSRGDQPLKRVASVTRLDARVGDSLRLSSDFGDVYELSVSSARRSTLGNKIIAGRNDAGARLTLVVTSDGIVQGSLRDAGQTFRISQNGDKFALHAAEPYMAKPVDARAADRPNRFRMIELD